MKLWIVRHGIARDVGENGIARDEDRTLSPKGVRRTREAACALGVFGAAPDRIASSPLPRALETAALLSEALNRECGLDLLDGLRPGGDMAEAWHWMRRHAREAQLMIVGHMPDVSVLAAQCIARSADAAVRFGKAAACGIEFDALPERGYGVLDFLLQPAALRAAAKNVTDS